MDGSVPGIESHINFLIEGQRSKMSIAAAHIIDWRRQGQILIIGTLDRAQKAAKIGKVSQLKKQKILRFSILEFRLTIIHYPINLLNNLSYSAATESGLYAFRMDSTSARYLPGSFRTSRMHAARSSESPIRATRPILCIMTGCRTPGNADGTHGTPFIIASI